MKNYQILEALDKEFANKLNWFVTEDNLAETTIIVTKEDNVKESQKYLDWLNSHDLRLLILIDKVDDTVDLSIGNYNHALLNYKAAEDITDIETVIEFVKDYFMLHVVIDDLKNCGNLYLAKYETMASICRGTTSDIFSHDGNILNLVRDGINLSVNTNINPQNINKVANLFNEPTNLEVRVHESIPYEPTGGEKFTELLPYLENTQLTYTCHGWAINITFNDHISIHIIPMKKKYLIYLENEGKFVRLSSMGKKKMIDFIGRLSIIMPSYLPYLLMSQALRTRNIDVLPINNNNIAFRNKHAFNSSEPYNLSIDNESVNTKFIECLRHAVHLLK